MTLGTHVAVGATVAVLFPSHPIIAFLAGFFSHYLLDAIPHWDYKLLSEYANPDKVSSTSSVKADKCFILDLLRIGLDALVGLLVACVLWYPIVLTHWQILVLGAIGAMLPDFLQFVYARFNHQPMKALQKFHVSVMHAEKRLDNRPIIGVITQILTILIVFVIVKLLIKF